MALSIGTDALNALVFKGEVNVQRIDAASRYTLTIPSKQVSSIEVIQQSTIPQCLALTTDNGLYVLNLLTGDHVKIYQFEPGAKVNSITTSPQGNIYVVTQPSTGTPAAARLQELAIDPIDGNAYKLLENEFTKSFDSFSVSGTDLRTGKLDNNNVQSYKATQFHMGYDGSPYIIARNTVTPAGQQDGQLFLASPSGDSDQQKNGTTGAFSFTKISGDSQFINEVVAVNATTALAMAFNKNNIGPFADRSWLSYSSASGLPSGAEGLLLPLDTPTIFWWDRPKAIAKQTAADYLPASQINKTSYKEQLYAVNISPSLALNLYKQPIGQDTDPAFASYLIPPLLPVQPSALKDEIGEAKVTPLNSTSTDYVLSTSPGEGIVDHLLFQGTDIPVKHWSSYLPGRKLGDVRVITAKDQASSAADYNDIYVISFHNNDNADTGSRYAYANSLLLDDVIANITQYRYSEQTRSVFQIGREQVSLSAGQPGAADAKRWDLKELEKLLNESEVQITSREDGNRFLQLENAPGSLRASLQLEEAELLDPAVDQAVLVYGSIDPGVNSLPSYELQALPDIPDSIFQGFEFGFTPTISLPWKTGSSKELAKKFPLIDFPLSGNWTIEVGGGLKSLTFDRTKEKPWSMTYTAQGKAGAKLKLGSVKIDSPYQEAGGNKIENNSEQRRKNVEDANAKEAEAKQAAADAKAKLPNLRQRISDVEKNIRRLTQANMLMESQLDNAGEAGRQSLSKSITQNNNLIDEYISELDSLSKQLNEASFENESQTEVANKQKEIAGDKANKVKEDQSEFSISATGGANWKYAGFYFPLPDPGNAEELSWSAGVELGLKRPIVKWNKNVGVYGIFNFFIGFQQTTKFDQSKLQTIEIGNLNDSMLASLFVLINKKTGKEVAADEIGKLSPEEIGWDFKYNPVNMMNPDLLNVINKIAPPVQYAVSLAQYIPPPGLITLAIDLVEGNTPFSEEDPSLPPSQLALMFQGPTGVRSIQVDQESTQLAILDGVPSEGLADTIQSSTLLRGDSTTGALNIKSKTGIEGNATLAKYLACEAQGLVQYDLKLGFGGGSKSSFAISAIISGKFRFPFFDLPISFTVPIYKGEFGSTSGQDSGERSAIQLINTSHSLAFQNLLASEAFSPAMGQELNLRNQYFGGYISRDPEIQSYRQQADGSYVGLIVASTVVGQSHSGLLANLYTINGKRTVDSGPIVWDFNTKKLVTTGFINSADIEGFTSDGRPIITLQTAPDVSSAIASTTSATGGVSVFSIEKPLLSAERLETANFDLPGANLSAALGAVNVQIPASKTSSHTLIATSAPSKDLQYGEVYIYDISKELGKSTSTQLKDLNTLRFTPNPQLLRLEDNIRFGEIMDTFTYYDKDPGNPISILTISVNGGYEKEIPIAYGVLNVDNLYSAAVSSEEVLDGWEKNSRYLELYSAFSEADMASRDIKAFISVNNQQQSSNQTASSVTVQPNYVVAYAAKDISSGQSALQFSSLDLKVSTQPVDRSIIERPIQNNWILPAASIDTTFNANHGFGGSVTALGDNCFAAGTYGSVLLANAADIFYAQSENPIVAVENSQFEMMLDMHYYKLTFDATYESLGKQTFDLFLQLATGSNPEDSSFSLADLQTAVLKARSQSFANQTYNFSAGINVTSWVRSLALDRKDLSASLSIDGLTIADSSSLLKAVSVEPTRLKTGSISFMSNEQALQVGAVASFENNKAAIAGGAKKSDWLSISTDPSDGNAICYLITDSALLQRIKQGTTNLWLDSKPLGSQDELFVQGKTGLAFLQGSQISTFVSNDKKSFIAISMPYNLAANAVAANAGRVAILDYEKLVSYVAKNPNPDLPFIDPFDLISAKAVDGYVINGNQAQDMLGTGSIVVTDTKGQHLLTGRPGQLDSTKIESLSNHAATRVVIPIEGTSDGFQRDQILPNTEGRSPTFIKQVKTPQQGEWLIYTVQSSVKTPLDIIDQDIYAFNLDNGATTKIDKPFYGQVIDILGDSLIRGKLVLTVTNTETGQNYLVTSAFDPTPRQVGDTRSQWGAISYDPTFDPQLVANTGVEDVSRAQAAGSPMLPTILKQLNQLLDPLSVETYLPKGRTHGISIDASKLHPLAEQLRIKLLDGTLYEGKDYSELDEIIQLAGQQQINYQVPILANYDSRRQQFATARLEQLDRENNPVAASERRLYATPDPAKPIQLQYIGIGAAATFNPNTGNGDDSSLMAISATTLPYVSAKTATNAAALLSVIASKDARIQATALNIVEYDNKNFSFPTSSTSQTGATQQTIALATNEATTIAAVKIASSNHLLVRSGNQVNSTLAFYKLPDTYEQLNSSTFSQAAFSLSSSSPGTGQILQSFTYQGVEYLAIGDPADNAVYILRLDASLANGSIAERAVKILRPDTITQRAKYGSSAFGSSLAFGLIQHDNISINDQEADIEKAKREAKEKADNESSLVIGAPFANQSNTSLADGSPNISYGGAVFAVKVDTLFKVDKKDIIISSSNQATRGIKGVVIDGQTSINNNDGTDGYQASNGPQIGSSLAFAQLFYPDPTTNQIRPFQTDSPQLLVGAPTQTIGYSQVQPGAVYILDVNPKDVGLDQNLYDKTVDKIKQIDLYPWVFAYGNQRGLGGSLMYGENSGDLFGSRIINVGNFVGNGADEKPRDVVAFPSPAALFQSGSMPMYIANNNFPAQSFQIDPFSDEGHSFQYLGDDRGANPPLEPAGSGFASNSSALTNFAPQIVGGKPSAQRELVINRVAKPSDPGAYFLYGKPYLFAGEQIASSNISGGSGFAVAAAGVPIALGDLNGDGFDDYTFYPVIQIADPFNSSLTTDKELDFSVYYGASPSALSSIEPRTFQTIYPQTISSNFIETGRDVLSLPYQAASPWRFSYFDSSSSTQAIYSSQTGTASTSIQKGLLGVDSRATHLIANGFFVDRGRNSIASNQEVIFSQKTGSNDLVISLADNINANAQSTVVSYGSVESILPIGKLVRSQAGVGARTSTFFASRTNGGFGPSQMQHLEWFRLDHDLKPVLLWQDVSLQAFFTHLSGSFVFGDSIFVTGYNINYPNNIQTITPFVYKLTLDQAGEPVSGGLTAFASFANPNGLDASMLEQSVINSIGDFNADGLPDIIRMTKQAATIYPNKLVNDQQYKIAYGKLDGLGALVFSDDSDSSQSLQPLPNQASVAPFSIGDIDGTGGDDLAIGAIPQKDSVVGYPTSLTSFVVYDTEVSVGVTTRRTGGAGDDILTIDQVVLTPATQGQASQRQSFVFNGKQGNDSIDFTDEFAVSNYATYARSWLSFSGGSGDDLFRLSDRLVARLNASKQPFSLRGDGGFDEVIVSQSTLNSDSRLDLTPLVVSSEDIENLTMDIPNASLDLSKLASRDVDYFSRQPLWIDGKAGASLELRYATPSLNTEPFIQDNPLTRLGVTYDVLRDPISGLRVAISTNLSVTKKGYLSSPGSEFTLGADLQPILRVASPDQVVKMELSSDAAFANSIGFYPLNAPDGSITDPVTGQLLSVDHAQYLSTARRLAAKSGFTAFEARSSSGQVIAAAAKLAEGLWAPIVLTETGSTSILYSSFASAVDQAQHFRVDGNSLLQFEDLPLGGSDFDWDDAVVRLV